MKKQLLAIAIILTLFDTIKPHTESYYPLGFPLFMRKPHDRREEWTGQSFMFTRPIYDNIAAKNSPWWYEALWDNPYEKGFSFQAIAMYQKVLPRQRNGRYFFIDNQNTLYVRGDNAPPTPNSPFARNVRAEWIGLPDTFEGTITINPRQEQGGVYFQVKQDLKQYIKHSLFERAWISIILPYQYVKNNIDVSQQTFQTDPETTPNTTIQAFNNVGWLYGKIPTESQKKNGFGELQFELGTKFIARDGLLVGGYSGVVAPLGGTQNATYMFSPFLGHNNHWGFISGALIEIPLNTDTDKKLCTFFLEIENILFIRNYQWRTLDLRDKKFSRYLLLNKLDGTKNIPAVNVLTQRVKVNPYNFVDMAVGFRYTLHSFQAEVAYNLWAHGDENLVLKHHFEPEYGIAGDGALLPGTNIGATASRSTIQELAPNDETFLGDLIFVPIHEYDLDLESGAARGATCHRASITFGGYFDQCSFALFWGLGIFAEVSPRNTAFNQWGLWAKIGGSF